MSLDSPKCINYCHIICRSGDFERWNLLVLVAVAEENPHITQQKMTKRTPRLLVLKILPLIYKEENKRTPSVDIRTIQIINVYPKKDLEVQDLEY